VGQKRIKAQRDERSPEDGLQIMELTHRVGIIIVNANSESIGNAEGRCSQRKYEQVLSHG
jgi:hypothetical protein